MPERSERTSRPELGDLGPDTVELGDLARFPRMTGWFAPVLLAKFLLRVIVSDVFGEYADRRLLSAALDPVDDDERRRRVDLTGAMTKDADGAVWLDYVADLGDGFDATYAIAFLLAQRELRVPQAGNPLPRASALVMGGDAVYPAAKRDDYKIKMRLPYTFALPDAQDDRHLPLLLLPGNHDWYDGLVDFLAIFCREKPTIIGGWRTNQRRSYFAAKLTDNWWIWGIDIALVHDMDQPQADYFVAIARDMPQGANVILCSAEPGWYKAETDGDSFRTLSYAAWIAENAEDEHGERKDLKIPLVLSGDSHHYAHYVGDGTHYITSGGGGAFVHGTLELKPAIRARWLNDDHAILRLEQCYPTQAESRTLLNGNRKFGALNPGLTIALAALYLTFAFALTARWHWDVALIEYALLAVSLWGYSRYQERHNSRIIVATAGAHALAHMAVIGGLSWLALRLHGLLFGGLHWHWLFWLVYLAVFAFTLGRWLGGSDFRLVSPSHLPVLRHEPQRRIQRDATRQPPSFAAHPHPR